MIESIMKKPEGKTLEFKKEITNPASFLKTLVAFANTAGGRLIVGVGDDHEIVGVERPLLEEERLANIIYDSIEPTLVPNIEMFTVEGKTLLIVEVFLSGTRPHFIEAEGEASGVYVRLGSTNRKADRELIAELKRGVEGVSYDETPMQHLSLSDIDLSAAEDILGHSIDNETLLTLRLASHAQGKIVPTRGAILLFGKKTSFHFPDAWVQCGRFIGKDKSRIFDHIELYDHLPVAVDSIMLFLKKHAMRSADFTNIRRKDVWSIPLEILREVVINALVHADYSQRGAPIRVAFFDDRIEVENPGILLPGMTIADMKNGVSKIRNPVIARVFRELLLIEQWGSGIRRIFKEAEELGLPEPKILELGMRLRFIVFLNGSVKIETTDLDRGPDGAQSGALWISDEQDEQVRKMLVACIDGEKTKQKLLKSIGLANAFLNFKNHVMPLIDKGLLERTIPEKPTSRYQKYRLTGKGKEWLAVNSLITDSIEQDIEQDEQDIEQVNNMLKECLVSEKTRQELLVLAGYSNAYLNYKNHIIPLLDKGLLERTIPDKPTSRLQKYRLTDKGKEWLLANRFKIDSIEQDIEQDE